MSSPKRTKRSHPVARIPLSPAKDINKNPLYPMDKDITSQDTTKAGLENMQNNSNEHEPKSLNPITPIKSARELLAEDARSETSNSPSSIKKQPGSYSTSGGGYNAIKTFNGQTYTGMAVGGSHTWNYDQGVWKETKKEPDLWEVEYETKKRRAKNAPDGSGANVGTEYHWLIVAHQYVTKTDANTYETRLVGSKYKLAHKMAASNSWSVPTVKAQRERELELLDDAKRRVQGLPPVLAGEKVKVDKREKGQQKLDALFASPKTSGVKRKVDDRDDEE